MEDIVKKLDADTWEPLPSMLADDARKDLRSSWAAGKKAGTLTGCGLMGKLTMEEIEELQVKVDDAMTFWSKMAGTFMEDLKDPACVDKVKDAIANLSIEIESVSRSIYSLEREVASLKKEIKSLKFSETVIE